MGPVSGETASTDPRQAGCFLTYRDKIRFKTIIAIRE